jgi:hypothetical protein
MMRFLIPAAIIIGLGAAVAFHAIEAKHVREGVASPKPMKLEVADKNVKETYDPRYDLVATVLAQRGWICGKVINVKPLKGDRHDVISFSVSCLEVRERKGEKEGTLRVYVVTTDREVVQSILDNRMPDRKKFVHVTPVKREEYTR